MELFQLWIPTEQSARLLFDHSHTLPGTLEQGHEVGLSGLYLLGRSASITRMVISTRTGCTECRRKKSKASRYQESRPHHEIWLAHACFYSVMRRGQSVRDAPSFLAFACTTCGYLTAVRHRHHVPSFSVRRTSLDMPIWQQKTTGSHPVARGPLYRRRQVLLTAAFTLTSQTTSLYSSSTRSGSTSTTSFGAQHRSTSHYRPMTS